MQYVLNYFDHGAKVYKVKFNEQKLSIKKFCMKSSSILEKNIVVSKKKSIKFLSFLVKLIIFIKVNTRKLFFCFTRLSRLKKINSRTLQILKYHMV